MTSSVVANHFDREGTIVHNFTHAGYELEVLPERGGRVISLQHGDHGEWLADDGKPWPTTPPVWWADGDVRGWDECLPNVAPGIHPELGIELADHGEVWNRPWDWQPTPTGIRTRIGGRLMPFEFQRLLGLTGSGVSARYRFENVSDTAYSIGWAMHLLLRGEPRLLQLPDDVPVRIDSTFGLETSSLGDSWKSWGDLRRQLPMTSLGWAAKIFTKAGSTSEVSLESDHGAISVSISETPIPASFGLWINACGWPSGDPVAHIGVEPGFGDHDFLPSAIEAKTTLSAKPKTTYTWKVSLHAE
jgi:galactose mutarotase-like enzyme